MSAGAAAGVAIGGLGLLVGIVGLVIVLSRSKTPPTPTPIPPPAPPPPVPQGGGGGTDWGAMVAGIAGAATSIAGMFA